MLSKKNRFDCILKHLKDRIKNNTIFFDIGSYSLVNRYWFLLKNDDTNYITNLIEYIEIRFGYVKINVIEKIISKFDNEEMK